MFDFDDTHPLVNSELAAAFRFVWDRLAKPGTWWTGIQRVAIAEVARLAYEGSAVTAHPSLPSPAVDAASVLSRNPSAVTKQLIEEWEEAGLEPNRYVELIGVVSQLTAVDTFHRALVIDLEPLPPPRPGEPSRQLPETPAHLTRAWVPMVGPPTIPTSLSAVPAEMDALEKLHGPMYLTYEEMGDPATQRDLSRAQIELVASRTSAINECFF